jgi:5'(3')-deoxyribonucleotidase
MKNTYIIDLDSTIIDTCKSIINLHNKLNDKKIKYQENYSWNFYPMIKTKEELSELFKLFDHEEFYDDTLVVFDKAIEVINELSKDNIVKIATKHDMLRRPITQKWIEETFPNVELIFLDSFDKSSVGKCNIFIDDKLEAIESMDSLADYRICYGEYDWNKDYNDLRVNDWSELYKMVKNIENTKDSNNKLIELKNNNEEKDGIKRWEF